MGLHRLIRFTIEPS